MCKSWCEFTLGIVIAVFALLPNWAGSKWILFIAGLLLIYHSFTCKRCFVWEEKTMPKKLARKRR